MRKLSGRRDRQRAFLDGTQVGVFFVGVGQPSVAGPQKRETVFRIQRPVSPVERSVSSGSGIVAGVDEIDNIGEPLPLRSFDRRVEIGGLVPGPEFTKIDWSLRIARVARIAPRIGGIVTGHRSDAVGRLVKAQNLSQTPTRLP